jgi:hypothetical protein
MENRVIIKMDVTMLPLFKLQHEFTKTLYFEGPPLWSSGQTEYVVTDPQVMGSISGAARFSEK